tara:strand:- start:1059 stop:1757 length:699 start_codon:yes stop_codon:yes gene_type:complete
MKKHTKKKLKGGFVVGEDKLHIFARKSREEIYDDAAEKISQVNGDDAVEFVINRVLTLNEIIMIADTNSLEIFTKVLFISYIRILYNHHNEYSRDELRLVNQYIHGLFSFILSYSDLLETFYDLFRRSIPEYLDVNYISYRGLLINEIIGYECRQGVEFLLNNGADINKTDLNGISPIIMATIRDNLDLFKLLEERGANLNQKDGFGLNVYKRLSSMSNSKITKYMREKNQI